MNSARRRDVAIAPPTKTRLVLTGNSINIAHGFARRGRDHNFTNHGVVRVGDVHVVLRINAQTARPVHRRSRSWSGFSTETNGPVSGEERHLARRVDLVDVVKCVIQNVGISQPIFPCSRRRTDAKRCGSNTWRDSRGTASGHRRDVLRVYGHATDCQTDEGTQSQTY